MLEHNDFPHHIETAHWQEWQRSGVHPDLVRLNVESIAPGDRAYEFLFYTPQVPRTNTGRLAAWILKKYQSIEDGGQWFNGLDPLNDWKPMVWGRFKPNTPRIDPQADGNKRVRYESPFKDPARLTCFRVPLAIWEQVSQRYRVPLPDTITLTSAGEALGFWAWVQAHPQIPIVLTEGEKKAACLLSLGFVAIALPGIWMGTRKGASGIKLHPDLVPLTQPNRSFIVLFDYETNPKTRKAIYTATLRLGEAIASQGCGCEVAVLPGKEKGIDDWVVALGNRASKAVTALIADAYSLKDYRASTFVNRCRGLQQYKPSRVVSTRYLSQAVQMPQSGLVVLLSDMATGKTELMAQWRQSNPNVRFLNNGHRVTLLKNLSERLKTESYAALDQGDLAKAHALSITADSLYKLSSDVQTYGCIFIDEACQYLAHLLHSKTCKDQQAEILDCLEWLVYNAPLVVIADAHMDDVTIDFFKAMRPADEQPFIIRNTHKGQPRDCHWYEGKNSSALVASICAAAWAGQKAFIVSDSKRFIKKLERVLNDLPPLPELENEDTPEPKFDRQLRVWAIHSENSGSEENVVFIKSIRYAIKEKKVDFLLASPSLGTGVDMPDYHFDVIFGAFHAVTQTATECVQMLWRYRPNVPMHVWVAPYPPFGFKPCNAAKLKQQILDSNRMTAFLIRRDRETGARGAEKDWALDAYCRIQAQRHFSINSLRADLKLLLVEMGTQIIAMGDAVDDVAKARMQNAGEAIDAEHCQSVANAELIDKATYKARQSKDYLSPQESLECEKFRIWDAYGMEVTPALVHQDDGGRLIGRIIALEELLAPSGDTIETEGKNQISPPVIVADKDASERDALPLCFHWRNRSAAWFARFRLGLRDILQQLLDGVEFTGDEPILQNLKRLAVWASGQVKAILGTTLPPEQSPKWILSQLLQQLALKLKSHKVGPRGEQVSYSGLDPEAIEFALQVLEHRRHQQAARDQKRQERREQNQAHAARMQTMYGTPPVSAPPDQGLGTKLRGGFDTTATVTTLTESAAEKPVRVVPCTPEEVEDLASNIELCPSAEVLVGLWQCQELPEEMWQAAERLLKPETRVRMRQWLPQLPQFE